MRVNSINSAGYKVSFGDAYSTKQEQKAVELQKEIREKVLKQGDDGIRVAKLYVASLPSAAEEDTGVGKPDSDEDFRIAEMFKVYFGANALKYLPIGQLTNKKEWEEGYASPYMRSSFTLGEDTINFNLLKTPQYGGLLKDSEVQEFVDKNKNTRTTIDKFLHNGPNISDGDKNYNINFENELGLTDEIDYPVTQKLLRKAYDRMMGYDSEFQPKDSEQLEKLKQEFEEFKGPDDGTYKLDKKEILTRVALYPWFRDYTGVKVEFFDGYDSDPNVRAQKKPEYDKIKQEHAYDIDFFMFRQFMAHKQLQESRAKKKEIGIETFGDCPSAFSWPEEELFPDAFKREGDIQHSRRANTPHGFPVPRYNEMHNKDSAAYKLFKNKIQFYLEEYDGVRLDMGWAYMRPNYHYGDKYWRHDEDHVGNSITNIIEETAKEVKGEDFDQRKILYECDADSNDFNMRQGCDKYLLDNIKGLPVFSTSAESNDGANIGWGNTAFIKYNNGYDENRFIIGPTNQDSPNILKRANNNKGDPSIGALMRVFNRMTGDGWKEFKDNDDPVEHVKKYTRGRFAETIEMKHNFGFYTDILGKKARVDLHSEPENLTQRRLDYRYRLERNYEENFHKGLQASDKGTNIKGSGLNLYEVYRYIMQNRGYDKEHPELYSRVEKYAEYLKHTGGIYSREQADNSDRKNLDIDSLTLEQIKNL